MLRYFKINDPYRLVGLLILMTIICLPLFLDLPSLTIPQLDSIILGEKLNEGRSMYSELIDNSAPLSAWFYELSDSLFGRSAAARYIAGFLLLFLQACYLAIILIVRKAFNENTFIPAFLFMLLALVSFDMFWLSAELVGLIFLLLALNALFIEIEFRASRDETVFNIGLFISLASLFAFSYSIFLFFAFFVLAFFTRSDLRKFLLLIVGFLLPHVFALTIAYLRGSIGEVWEYAYLSWFSLERVNFLTVKSLLKLAVVPLIYFVVSIIMLQREARFSKYQSQILQIFFLWILFSVVFVLLAKEVTAQSLVVFLPAFAFLFSHFFLFIRRKKFAEMNFWILLIGMITTFYLARYHRFGIDYSRLFPSSASQIENKRIMVLENSSSYFVSNQMAGPFLDWRLSKSVFDNPDYYENIVIVHEALTNDPPDVIIDKQDLMRPFFKRMPELKAQYQRRHDRYFRR